MDVIIWARVSSREQREGYSLDAQLRATREKAQKSGWSVVREFVVAESAKRGAERLAFNEMLAWVKANASKLKIKALLSHKLDRVCRNMRDAVRLQELEDTLGVQLVFVENQFGSGAAGLLSFNVMAAVAQYYSDNLRAEVLKGMDEKVRQGWPTGLAPFGYLNVDDKEEPVQPHPEESKALVRIFELYATGRFTLDALSDRLVAEGFTYRPSQPKFPRTSLSGILTNRFYVGELERKGQVYAGGYRLVIDRKTFELCQDILQGRNRRTGNPEVPMSGGVMRCAYCGFALTGERIRRRLKDGGIREHLYYRCANNYKPADHPVLRWRAEDLEEAILQDLDSMKMPSAEIAGWFKESLRAVFADAEALTRQQRQMLAKRKTELGHMQDRLLNGYLAGLVEEPVFHSKSAELKREKASVEANLSSVGGIDGGCADRALKVFEFSQNVGQIWRRSNWASRCEILESVSLNREVDTLKVGLPKRSPFDYLCEKPFLKIGRGGRI